MPKGKPIALCDTSKMSESEWLLMRTGKLHGIPCTVGGSEASCVFDLNPWTCSKELYDKKRNVTPGMIKEFNADSKAAGHRFEPYVQEMFVDWFLEVYSIQLTVCKTIEEFNSLPNAIYNDNHFYQCGETDEQGNLKNPQAVGNVDGLIKVNWNIGVLEYKTMSSTGSQKHKIAQLQHGKPMIYYDYQVRHYMGVVNVNFGFLITAWGFKMPDISVIPFQRDLEIEEQIFEGERNFAKCVINNENWTTAKCDPVKLANYYTRLYGPVEKDAPPLVLASSYFSIFKQLYDRKVVRESLQRQIDELDRQDAELISMLSPIVQNASFCICRKGTESVSINIKTPTSTGKTFAVKDDASARMARIDVDRMKTENPDLYEQFLVKVFDAKTFKQQRPAEFYSYKLPNEPTGDTNTYEATYKSL